MAVNPPSGSGPKTTLKWPRDFFIRPILSEGSKPVKHSSSDACLREGREIEFDCENNLARIRTTPAAEKRARHDHCVGLCTPAVRYSARRSQALSGRSGIAAARPLPLATGETQGHA